MESPQGLFQFRSFRHWNSLNCLDQPLSSTSVVPWGLWTTWGVFHLPFAHFFFQVHDPHLPQHPLKDEDAGGGSGLRGGSNSRATVMPVRLPNVTLERFFIAALFVITKD